MASRGSAALLMGACLLGAGCRNAPAAPPRPDAALKGAGAAVLPRAGDAAEVEGDWVRASRDFSNTRYSPLRTISRESASKLALEWTFSTGVLHGHEAAPLVVGGTMFIVTPFPNTLFALDLTRHGAPVKWRYDPAPSSSSRGVACCDVVNRGAAYDAGRVYFNTLDSHTVAVDAETGQEVWRTRVGDIGRGETMTMAPLVVKGKVLVGNSGGEYGVRGWLTALDAATGAIAWRAYSTGPDADVLIGPAFRPFYAQDRGRDLGVHSWPAEAWRQGGGTVWGFLSYDPDLDLIYYGTGNPGPWNPGLRPGDNKWTAGVFARDPDTGEARWFYQYNPHDLYDWDGINEHILLDLRIAGHLRKVLVHPERNGYMYVLDRATGQVLTATPYAYTNTVSEVDLKTGRPRHVASKEPVMGSVVRDICPAAPGAKDWQPAAFSPRTGLVYLPHNNLCMDFEGLEANYIAGTPYVGANVRMFAGPGGHRGEFTAWDPVGATRRWSVQERFPVWSGAVVTAGDVVFYGTMDGWFKALDATDGTLLWQHKVGSGVIGQPVVYRGPDGKDHVAVLAGVGGWAGAVVSGELDARDVSAANGFAGAMADLPQHTTRGGTLYVFGLP